MNAFWDFYWPLLTASVVVGVVAGAIGFRAVAERQPKTSRYRRHAATRVGIGVLVVLTLGAIWHAPAGTSERFAATVDRRSRQVLDDWEMAQVQAHLERDPLMRTLVLSGPADDFQRGQLLLIMDGVPGVARVRWADMKSPAALPLFAEAELAALVCFSLGLLLAYLLELRRRYRAQWSW